MQCERPWRRVTRRTLTCPKMRISTAATSLPRHSRLAHVQLCQHHSHRRTTENAGGPAPCSLRSRRSRNRYRATFGTVIVMQKNRAHRGLQPPHRKSTGAKPRVCSCRGQRSTGRMSSLPVLRGMSNVLACLVVRAGSGGQPTDRWQDKSREARPGRSVGKWRHIRHFARCATKRDSLQVQATLCKLDTSRTSHASVP